MCPFIHPKNHCTIENCKEKNCKKRHIKDCKNWKSGFCKFTNDCEYKHDPQKVYSSIMSNKNEKNDLEKSDFDTDVELASIKKEFDNDTPMEYSESDLDSCIEQIVKEYGETIHDNSLNKNEKSKQNAKLTCDKCNYTLQNKRDMKKHMKSYHESACDKCNYISQNKGNFKNHVESCQG